MIRLERKAREQLQSQRVGYLLGAGSSYLDGHGYPLATGLWDCIKEGLQATSRADIQAKLDTGAGGLEAALDLLDDGGAVDTPYRHEVTEAIAVLFAGIAPPLEIHRNFVSRLSARSDPHLRVFTLNYDPLIERASDSQRLRIVDGFAGTEHAFFAPCVLRERLGEIRGSYRGRQFDETVRPIRLVKLHGSLGWYETKDEGPRRQAFDAALPADAHRLMIPPQRRKVGDTMVPPYSALWSDFRACMVHGDRPLNRLACFGYGFADEHVNTVIEAAMVRGDFTLLAFTRGLNDVAWERWSQKPNAVLVTEQRCSLNGEVGPGHAALWKFEQVIEEV